jgi:hypothetical protein
MGFLSRKKPKPAPLDIQEEHSIVDELQEMEEAVPERPVEPPRLDIEDPQETIVEEEPTAVHQAVAPEAVDEPAEEPALNAEEPEEEDDGRMKAVDLIAPTRLDFLAEKEAAAEEPVKTAEVIAFANH